MTEYDPDEKQWYVCYCNIRCEDRAEDGLRAKGYDTCLPKFVKWRRPPKNRRKLSEIEKERRAAEEIAVAQGITDPKQIRKIALKAAGKVEYPLFVRYLFVGVDTRKQGFYPIRLTDGVESILGIDGVPMPVSGDLISDLRLGMVNGSFDYTIKKQPKSMWQAGQMIRVAEGPFAGFIGTVASASTERRVEILIEMFKRETLVYADPLHLRSA